MICDEAAEFVSALCDGEMIPPVAAEHIGGCDTCQWRLRDYLAQGAELRRVASLETTLAMQPLVLPQRLSTLATWWRKGWADMRVPRLAFAILIAGVVILTSVLAVGRVRAQHAGNVVLVTTTGPDGFVLDCPMLTDKENSNCSWFGDVGANHLAYKMSVVSRSGDRIRLAIRTRTFFTGQNLSAFTQDGDPGAQTTEAWFKPGETLKIDVPEVGTLTLKGDWIDRVPIPGALDPGPQELRFGRPLLLKDGTVVGDWAGAIGGYYSQDNREYAAGFSLPGEGRFLIAQVPIKGAVEAHVSLGRISFLDGGHSWEFVSGVPVSRADHLWVLHQPNVAGHSDQPSFSNPRLVQVEPGLWTTK